MSRGRAARDPVSEALAALVRGDFDAPVVLDVIEGRVLCNRTERDLVAELRGVAIGVARHCGALHRCCGRPKR